MYKSDIKILELIQILKSLGKIQYDYEFCNSIGFLKQNLVRVKENKAHFTAQHIENICAVYDVDANWIFRFENKIFTKIKSNQKSVQNTSNQQN